jgi:NUMOD3 motif
MKFYAYLWLRKNGTPYYVGKGCGKRVYCSVLGHRPPKDRSRIVILNRSSEVDAFKAEMELIFNWGRKDLGTGCLHNRSDGGEGSKNFSAETLQKLREARRGRKPCLGHKHSKETRLLMSEKRKGGKPFLGHKHSKETRCLLGEVLEKNRPSRLGCIPWNKGKKMEFKPRKRKIHA